MPATHPNTRITIASEIDGVHPLIDNTTHEIKIPFSGLHLTFTRKADTVVLNKLDTSTIVVECLGETGKTRTTLTDIQAFTITDCASVFYYCKERDNGSLYVDEEAVFMLHFSRVF